MKLKELFEYRKYKERHTRHHRRVCLVLSAALFFCCFNLLFCETSMQGVYEGFPLYRNGFRLGYDLYPDYRPAKKQYVIQIGGTIFNPPLLFDPADYGELEKLEAENRGKSNTEAPLPAENKNLQTEKTEEKKIILSNSQKPEKFNSNFLIIDEKSRTIESVLSQTGASIKTTGTQKTIHLHGFTSSNINVYVDGVLINSQQNGEVDFNLIDLESIHSITYFSPVQSPEPSVGGSLFITTKSDYSDKITLNLHQNISTLFHRPVDSTYTSASLAIPVKFKSGYLTIKPGINYLYSHNRFIVRKDNVIHEREEGKLHNLHSALTFDFNFLSKVHNLKATAEYGMVNQVLTPYFPVKPPYTEKLKDQKSTTMLAYSFNSPSGFNTTKLSAGFKYSRQDYSSPAEKSLHILYEPTMLFETGFNFLEHYGISFKSTNNFVVLNSSNLDKKNMLRGSASLINKFVFQPFTLELNNRILYTEKKVLYTPGISMDLTFPTEKNSYSAGINVSRAGQFPTANQLYWKPTSYGRGNPNLKLEHGIFSEVYTQIKSPKYSLRISGTCTYYKDKIIWQPDKNNVWQPENLGKSIFAGSIANLEYKPIDSLTLACNYDFIVAALLPPEKGVPLYYGKRIMYVPEHTLTLKAVYDNGALYLEGNLAYNSFRYLSNANLETLPSKINIGTTVMYRFKYLSPYISFDNLTNDQTPSSENYPSSGVKLTIGIKTSLKLGK